MTTETVDKLASGLAVTLAEGVLGRDYPYSQLSHLHRILSKELSRHVEHSRHTSPVLKARGQRTYGLNYFRERTRLVIRFLVGRYGRHAYAPIMTELPELFATLAYAHVIEGLIDMEQYSYLLAWNARVNDYLANRN